MNYSDRNDLQDFLFAHFIKSSALTVFTLHYLAVAGIVAILSKQEADKAI